LKFFFLFGFVAYQRDTVKAATKFAQRNNIPTRLEEQMLAQLLMKYRTDLEGVQQQDVIDSLPKAIRSSVSYCLFYPIMNKVYLFAGVSTDLTFQLVLFSFCFSSDLFQQCLRLYLVINKFQEKPKRKKERHSFFTCLFCCRSACCQFFVY
jgi:hypothetical protein